MRPDALDKIIIDGALAIINDAARWTTGTQARDQDGQPCASWDSAAVRWCFYGAMVVTALRLCSDRQQSLSVAHKIRRRMTIIQGVDPIAANDCHGREAMIALARRTTGNF
jgi:hypothetical protein